MSKETGGPAFPQSGGFSNDGDPFDSKDMGGAGITMRDYFAAKAMQALIPAVLQRCEGLGTEYPDNNLGLAKAAYEVADAMISVRSQ